MALWSREDADRGALARAFGDSLITPWPCRPTRRVSPRSFNDPSRSAVLADQIRATILTAVVPAPRSYLLADNCLARTRLRLPHEFLQYLFDRSSVDAVVREIRQLSTPTIRRLPRTEPCPADQPARCAADIHVGPASPAQTPCRDRLSRSRRVRCSRRPVDWSPRRAQCSLQTPPSTCHRQLRSAAGRAAAESSSRIS